MRHNQPTNKASNNLARPKVPILRQNTLFFVKGVKLFVPTYQKTAFAPHSHWILGLAWDGMGKKGQYLVRNTNFWPKSEIFGKEAKLLEPIRHQGKNDKFWFFGQKVHNPQKCWQKTTCKRMHLLRQYLSDLRKEKGRGEGCSSLRPIPLRK